MSSCTLNPMRFVELGVHDMCRIHHANDYYEQRRCKDKGHLEVKVREFSQKLFHGVLGRTQTDNRSFRRGMCYSFTLQGHKPPESVFLIPPNRYDIRSHNSLRCCLLQHIHLPYSALRYCHEIWLRTHRLAKTRACWLQ